MRMRSANRLHPMDLEHSAKITMRINLLDSEPLGSVEVEGLELEMQQRQMHLDNRPQPQMHSVNLPIILREPQDLVPLDNLLNLLPLGLAHSELLVTIILRIRLSVHSVRGLVCLFWSAAANIIRE